jgi:hypothetical protein
MTEAEDISASMTICGGKLTFVSEGGYDGAAIGCVAAHHMISGHNPTGRIVF